MKAIGYHFLTLPELLHIPVGIEIIQTTFKKSVIIINVQGIETSTTIRKQLIYVKYRYRFFFREKSETARLFNLYLRGKRDIKLASITIGFTKIGSITISNLNYDIKPQPPLRLGSSIYYEREISILPSR